MDFRFRRNGIFCCYDKTGSMQASHVRVLFSSDFISDLLYDSPLIATVFVFAGKNSPLASSVYARTGHLPG